MKATYDGSAICVHYHPWEEDDKANALKAFDLIQQRYRYAEIGNGCILVDENSLLGNFRSFVRWMNCNGFEA